MQRWLLFFVLALICVSINPEKSPMADNSPSSEKNRVLSLDGYGDYVEIADSERLNNIGSQVTMEAWIKPAAFQNDWMFIIYKGDKRVSDQCSNRSYMMSLNKAGFIHLASAPEGKKQTTIESPSEIIELNRWYHIAGVIDSKSSTMRIFINGSEVTVGSFAGNVSGKIHKSALPLRIGWSHEEEIPGHSPFGGLIDEVRIWSIARTQAEIQKTMHSNLSGNEPGLAGYWRFDEKAVTDSSPGHSDGKLIGYAHLVETEIPAPKTETRTGTEGVWKTYRYVDGLASNYIHAIMQDKEGAIWFGTDGGVSRYDGKSWKTYTKKDGLASDGVNAIMQDKEGAIWFGTWDGVSRFDGVSWKTYTQKDGLAGNDVNAVMQDREGAFWFGTWEHGVSRFDGKSWKTYTQKDGLAGNDVFAIMQDRKGSIWFGTWGKGVSRFDGVSWKTYTQKDGLANNDVRAIIQDKEGAIWFGTWGSGVSRFDEKSWQTYRYNDGLASDYVPAIMQDKEGAIWFGTWEGVSQFDGKIWETYTQKDGLAGNNVSAVIQDKEGTIWFGTHDGVSKFDGVSWKTYTQKDGLANNDTSAIMQDKEGAIWFGVSGVASRFDGKSWKTYIQDTYTVNTIYTDVFPILQDKEGVIWFGTGNGVSRFDGKSWKTYLAGNGVNAIIQDKKGIIWFGTYNGVSQFDGKSWKIYTQKDGLAINGVCAIMQDKEGAIWFGTNGGGVSRFDGVGWKTYTTKDGLANNAVNAIMQDKKGAIWFGTWGGVSQFDGKIWKTYAQKDGLAKYNVFAIMQDKEGTIWFGTDGGGISRFDGRCFQTIDSRDGLVSDNVRCIYMDRIGQIWIGTNAGVVRIIPNKVLLPIYIARMVADETYDNPKGTIQLRSGIPRIALSYHAISFKTRPGTMKYFYQLVGKDQDWQGATNEETIEYFNLKPGKYTFMVQAVDRDLNYSKTESIEIKILSPPIYTRAWFIIGLIMIAFFIPSVVYGGLLMRKKKQTFEPIPNPYIVGNPIRSKEMFFGREDDFEFVKAKLSSGQIVIVFSGERRSGKTSILFQILNGALGEDFVSVLLDMQAMTIDYEAEFFEKIASEINKALGERSELVSISFRDGNPTRAFENLIAQAIKALDGKKLLLLFDEYELIESKIDDGVLRPDVTTFLASLLEANPHLSYVFTGSCYLEQRNATYWRILIGKSLYRRISFLSYNDALRLITEPLKDKVTFLRGIPETIIRLTAGQPFYTQVVCQNLVDRLNGEQRSRVDKDDIDAVSQELSDNPLPQMIYFWDGLKRENQITLSLLGEVLLLPDRYTSAQMLLGIAQSHSLGINQELSDYERILDELFKDEVLERERVGEGRYEYRFRVDLFRLWIRQSQSIWQLV